MSYKRFFLKRIPMTLILAVIGYIITSIVTDIVLYNVLAILTITIIGLTITTIQFTRLKDDPSTLNNGGIPVDKIPNVTDEEILDEIRRLARGKPSEPEVIAPRKEIAVPQTKDFQTVTQDVLRQKIVAALERADFRLIVKGSMDTQGDIKFDKMAFGIKTGQQPIKEAVQEPEKKKTQVLKRPQVG